MCLPDARLTRRQSLSLAATALIASRFRGHRPRTVEVGGGLEIHPRANWGADLPPKGPLQPEADVRFLLVHHTAGTTNYSKDAAAQQIRGAYSFHTGPEKKWNDVCYNFFVDRYGGVWEGRAGSLDGPVMADATGGSQGFAQLVCLLGNFEENEPTSEMITSLEKVLAWMSVRYQIDPRPGSSVSFVSRGSNRWPQGSSVTARTISGHRDMSKTVCPGKFVYPLLETTVPDNVTALVAGWSGTPVVSSSPSFTTTESVSTSSSISTTTTEGPVSPLADSQSLTMPGTAATPTPTPVPTAPAPTTTHRSDSEDSAIAETARVVAITAAAIGVTAAGAAVVRRRDS